jgi:hypothetical protein
MERFAQASVMERGIRMPNNLAKPCPFSRYYLCGDDSIMNYVETKTKTQKPKKKKKEILIWELIFVSEIPLFVADDNLPKITECSLPYLGTHTTLFHAKAA